METSFLDQFTDLMDRRLSPHDRVEFYNKMNKVVVFIRATYSNANHQERRNRKTKLRTGAGIIISKEGVILTCSRAVPKKIVTVEFSFEENRDEFLEADVVHRDAELELALLLPRNTMSRNHAIFAPDDAVVAGMSVFMISHPSCLKYTFSCGEVSYPNYRLKEDVNYDTNPNDSDDCRLHLMRKGVELIQISNTHGVFSSIGSPVFDSCGRMLGLNCFSMHNLDFAIHVMRIKDFWNSSQNLVENFIQRRGQKEIETTQSMDIDSSSKGGSKSSRKGKGVSEGSSTYKGSYISKGSGMKSMIPFGEAFGLQKVADSYQNTRGMQNEDDSNNTTILVGGLNDCVSDEQLRQFFCLYGQLVHVEILVGKRCGLVQFADTRCADVALKMLNGTQLGGQKIQLSWGHSPSYKQLDQNQWNGGSCGYQPEYETFGCARTTQDPNMYYGSYSEYGNYQQAPQQYQQ